MAPRIFLSLLALCLAVLLPAQEELHQEYIELYKKISIQEMERTGIPASIKLAQGLLESSAGTSELASESNNHFGIKCGGDWTGTTYFLKDDDYDNDGNLLHSCFRVYKTPEESFIAHSDFLKNPKKEYRYGVLFKIKKKNYKKWAKGLKKAGYATSKTYDKKLINLIERYKLYEYDKMSSSELIAATKKEDEKLNKNKDLVSIDQKNDDYLDMVSPTKAEEEIIKRKENRPVRKKYRNSTNGKREWHFVEKGENIAKIAEKYDLKLRKLLRRNRLKSGQEPAIGERIKLRGRKVRTAPELREEKEASFASTTSQQVKPDATKMEQTNSEKQVAKKEEAPLQPMTDPNQTRPQLIQQEPVEEKTNNSRLLDMNTEDAIDLTNLPDDRHGVEAPKKKLSSQNNTLAEEKAQYEETEREEDNMRRKASDEVTGGASSVTKEESKEEAPTKTFYVVQKGDTLWSIALKHRTTVEEIRELNDLKGSKIKGGMKLRVK